MAPTTTISPKAPERVFVTITSSLRSKIRGLREHAAWSFRHIAQEVGIAVSTVYSICRAPATPQKEKIGRPKLITTPIRQLLVATATASQANRRLPLTQVAEIAEVQASGETLRDAFATEGYHRRIARVRPFLTPAAKIQRLDWAYHYADWTQADWHKVIWSDESTFNVGGLSSSGKVWVTRQAGEEDLEDCLVPKFPKLQTVVVWGCFKGTVFYFRFCFCFSPKYSEPVQFKYNSSISFPNTDHSLPASKIIKEDYFYNKKSILIEISFFFFQVQSQFFIININLKC